MIKLFDKLIDNIEPILITAVILFFIWGIGYLITIDVANSKEFKEQCVAAGMQYVSGSCVK